MSPLISQPDTFIGYNYYTASISVHRNIIVRHIARFLIIMMVKFFH